MERSSEPGERLEGEPPRHSFSRILLFVEKKAYVLLKDHRKRKWIWVILVALAAIQSYFVRQLLVAFLFFTVLYVILAVLVVLYILFVDVLDYGTVWLESLGRSALSLAHHHFISPAKLMSLAKERALHRTHKLGHG